MPLFEIDFQARKNRAIGAVYSNHRVVEAKNEWDALYQLHKEFEHVSINKIKEQTLDNMLD